MCIFTVHILRQEWLIDDIKQALLRHTRTFGRGCFIIAVNHRTEIILIPVLTVLRFQSKVLLNYLTVKAI